MISEVRNDQRRVYSVSAANKHDLNVIVDNFKKSVLSSPNQARKQTLRAAAAESDEGNMTGRRNAINHLLTRLQRIFLPERYPDSVTEDFLPVACWDMIQLLCSSITSTLCTRALLLNAGVGQAKANLASSTASWVLQDGVRLLVSVVFASGVSAELDYRSKTWRLVADLCDDFANFMQVCSPWFPIRTRLTIVVLSSALKAVVGVAGAGTRAALIQHFAKENNAADVTAKTGNRDNAGSLLGLTLGTLVACLTPATSRVATLTIFTLFSLMHAFANYKGVRATTLTSLNAPRLEWCMETFYERQRQRTAALKKDLITSSTLHEDGEDDGYDATSPEAATLSKKSGNSHDNIIDSTATCGALTGTQNGRTSNGAADGRGVARVNASRPAAADTAPADNAASTSTGHRHGTIAALAPWRGNAEERLFILAPPRSFQELAHPSLWSRLYTDLSYVLPLLKVNIRYGAPLYDLLRQNRLANYNAAAKQALVAAVQACLAARRVALVYDVDRFEYFVFLADPNAGRERTGAANGLDLPDTDTAATTEDDVGHNLPQVLPAAESSEPSKELSRSGNADSRRERLAAEEALAQVRRRLWAYFYAYSHQRASGFVAASARARLRASVQGDTARTPPRGIINAPATANTHPFYVIAALRADGVLDLSRQPIQPHPAHLHASDMALYEDDQLYPIFVRFFTALKRAGWKLDRLLIKDEGWMLAARDQ